MKHTYVITANNKPIYVVEKKQLAKPYILTNWPTAKKLDDFNWIDEDGWTIAILKVPYGEKQK